MGDFDPQFYLDGDRNSNPRLMREGWLLFVARPGESVIFHGYKITRTRASRRDRKMHTLDKRDNGGFERGRIFDWPTGFP